MPIAPVNQTKNIVSPVGQDRLGFFLMTEDDFILETEDGFLLMLDSATYGLSGENQAKSPNAGTTIHSGESIGLLLSLTYPTTFTLGSGWVNSNKN
jgi:hypothetical protein